MALLWSLLDRVWFKETCVGSKLTSMASWWLTSSVNSWAKVLRRVVKHPGCLWTRFTFKPVEFRGSRWCSEWKQGLSSQLKMWVDTDTDFLQRRRALPAGRAAAPTHPWAPACWTLPQVFDLAVLCEQITYEDVCLCMHGIGR